MRTLWQCDKCESKFDRKLDCLQHEEECKITITHTCDKCGKVTEYVKPVYGDSYIEEGCWTFTPNHYRAGYGSKLDGSEVVIHMCDDCLYEFVTSCVHEERIRNSGSNIYYDYPDDEDVQTELKCPCGCGCTPCIEGE